MATDEEDAFPNDITQWNDDGDGYGDNQNGNSNDAFPNDSTEWKDSDEDGEAIMLTNIHTTQLKQ